MSPQQLQSSRAFVTQLFDALGEHSGDDHDAALGQDGNFNPLEGAGSEVKKQLLALHVAFPNELLPALDLLDRTLVTRFRVRRDPENPMEETAPQNVRGYAQEKVTGGAGGTSAEGLVGEGSRQQPDGVGRADSSDADMLDAPLPVSTSQANSKEHADLQHIEEEVAMDRVYYVRSAQQRSSRYSTSYDATASYEVRLDAWNCSCPAFAFSAFPPVHPEPVVPMYDAIRDTVGEGTEWSFGGLCLGDGIPPVCKHLLACVLAERCTGLFGNCVQEKVVGVEEAAGWAAGWGD